LGWRSN